MRQEGGGGGRAGRNVSCDGLQDGTTPHVSFLRGNASEMQIATGFYMLVIGVRAGGERYGSGGRNITITRFLRATETAVSIINKKRQACVSEGKNQIIFATNSHLNTIKYKELQSHFMFY